MNESTEIKIGGCQYHTYVGLDASEAFTGIYIAVKFSVMNCTMEFT